MGLAAWGMDLVEACYGWMVEYGAIADSMSKNEMMSEYIGIYE